MVSWRKFAVVAVLGAGAAWQGIDGIGAGPVRAWAQEKEVDPKEAERRKDRGLNNFYLREYQKAPDRIWTFPEQVGVLIRHADDVVAWADRREASYNFKDRKDLDINDARFKDEFRRVRVYATNLKVMRAELAKEFPSRLEKLIQKADTETTAGLEKGTVTEFNKGRATLSRVNDMLVLAAALFDPADPGLAKAIDDAAALRVRIKQRQSELIEKTRGSTKPPTQQFKGSDAPTVTQKALEAWKAKYPDVGDATAVAASSTMQLRTRIWWDEKEKRLEIDDVTLQPVRIVVPADPGWSWAYTVMVMREGPSAAPTIVALPVDKDDLSLPLEQFKAP